MIQEQFDEFSRSFISNGLYISILPNYISELIIIHRDTCEDFNGDICIKEE